MAIAGELPFPTGDESVKPRSESVNTLVDLYSHHQQRIYRYCLALLRNPDDAEDATQETFTRAAPFLPKLPGDLSAYLTTVARNICCDVVRARSRKSVPIDNVPLTDRRVSPERQSVDWDVVRRMWRQLTPSERLLFAYTFAGYKYEEIATRTGMSRPSVSVGLARARRRLRDLAAATGTLALLPLAVRRLLERIGRRAGAAANSAPAVVMQVADQAGVFVAGLVAGAFTASASVVAMPGMVPTAAHHSTTSSEPGSSPAAAAAAALTTLGTNGANVASRPSGSARSSALPPPATPPAALAPATADLPGVGATPETTGINFMAASPQYSTDRTVYISGSVLGNDCVGYMPSSCAALFRTSDAGATWTRLALIDNTAGSILLPPTYPADPAFFVVTTNVRLLGSSRGDGTFDWSVPAVTAAAIAPTSTTGHDRLATVVDGAVAFFDAGNSTPQPGPALPASFVPTVIAYRDADHVVVGGYSPSAAAGGIAESVTVCPLAGLCAPATVFPDPGSFPIVSTLPGTPSNQLVVVTTSNHLFVSTDGGNSFKAALTAPGDRSLTTATVGEGPFGPRIVASSVDNSMMRHPVVLISDDLGATFTDATGNLNAISPLLTLSAYPDGTLLTGILASTTVNHFALRQSEATGVWIDPS